MTLPQAAGRGGTSIKHALTEVPPRPSWDDYFLEIAFHAATRATCLRRAVGAVLVIERRVIATGYNGSAPGMVHCTDAGVGCLLEPDGTGGERCVRTVHAEANAVAQAARYGIAINGATLYVTCAPCSVCTRLIASAGIRRVVYAGNPPAAWAREVLTASGIVYEGKNPIETEGHELVRAAD